MPTDYWLITNGSLTPPRCPPPTPFRSRFGRSRQAGRAGPKRRTGGYIVSGAKAAQVSTRSSSSRRARLAGCPVASLLQLQYGKGMKASERLDEGPVPVFGSNGLVGYCETPLTEAPAIIVGRKGSAGALNLCDGPSWTTDVAYFVEAPNYFDLRYLLIGLQTLNLGIAWQGRQTGSKPC